MDSANISQSNSAPGFSLPVVLSSVVSQTEPTVESEASTCSADATFLLNAMWPSSEMCHFVVLHSEHGSDSASMSDVDEVVSNIVRCNKYEVGYGFTCGEFDPEVNGQPGTPSCASAFWLLLTVGADGYAAMADARFALVRFCSKHRIVEPTHIIDAGLQMYAIWTLDQPLDVPNWQGLAWTLQDLASRDGLLGVLDKTSDIWTDLLIPGTRNFAMEPAHVVTLVAGSTLPIERDAMVRSIEEARAAARTMSIGADASTVNAPATTQVVGVAKSSVTTSPADAAQVDRPSTTRPFEKFSLLGKTAEVERLMVDEVPILGQLALKGQATAFFAAPNTGKTLITLHLLLDSLSRGVIDKSKLFYFNLDDSGAGLTAKLDIADEYGFHTIVAGFGGFQTKSYREELQKLIDTDTAREVVVVLDTLKNFVDTMHKSESRAFTRLARQFVLKGGTVIALAHTNKHVGSDGKPVPAGTSDIIDDFDCAYTLQVLPGQVDPEDCVVQFTNKKRRGSVVSTAGYSYAIEPSLSYQERLLSVRAVDPDRFTVMQEAAELVSDAKMIDVVTACISEGVNKKMMLADATAARSNTTKRNALKVIEKYSGDDPERHRWQYQVGPRGAKLFRLLGPASPLG